jgi:hypothetical protein
MVPNNHGTNMVARIVIFFEDSYSVLKFKRQCPILYMNEIKSIRPIPVIAYRTKYGMFNSLAVVLISPAREVEKILPRMILIPKVALYKKNNFKLGWVLFLYAIQNKIPKHKLNIGPAKAIKILCTAVPLSLLRST